jgi:predicted ABC-type ATPase
MIIAGPNRAGKTTLVQQCLPKEAGFPDSINVNLTAQGLSPFGRIRRHSKQARAG